MQDFLYLSNEYAPLQKKKTVMKVHDHIQTENLSDFAEKIVWFGRNKRAIDYSVGRYEVDIR